MENTRRDQEKKEREEAEFLALKLEVEEKNPTIRSQLISAQKMKEITSKLMYMSQKVLLDSQCVMKDFMDAAKIFKAMNADINELADKLSIILNASKKLLPEGQTDKLQIAKYLVKGEILGILEMLKHINNQMADVSALESLQLLEKTLISVQKQIEQAALLMKL